MTNKTYINYRQFDVVLIKKLHANNVFNCIKNKDYLIDFSKEEYIKTRPAIILKALNWSTVIIIPLTTKLFKGKGSNYMNELLRSEFDCNELPEKSYLMFEGIMRINRNQISNLFKVKKQRIELNNSTKEWLKKEALAKYTKLFE